MRLRVRGRERRIGPENGALRRPRACCPASKASTATSTHARALRHAEPGAQTAAHGQNSARGRLGREQFVATGHAGTSVHGRLVALASPDRAKTRLRLAAHGVGKSQLAQEKGPSDRRRPGFAQQLRAWPVPSHSDNPAAPAAAQSRRRSPKAVSPRSGAPGAGRPSTMAKTSRVIPKNASSRQPRKQAGRPAVPVLESGAQDPATR
jgi:hypothetical protein